MLQDATIRKSLDQYIKNRILEIDSEIKQTFPNIKKIWKCKNEVDFLYGYYVGKIEEGALHYLLKATRASAGGYVDSFEIRGIIEEHRSELINTIEFAINQ
ncbi:hypothetical protein Nisw_01990 [Candidatus Nitrosopumilus sp. SW]|uniref:hypothetical protein n=1 Tax=Candidatus Nitrosopumilus sp. SW TaxID=2508726 RepID=UPI0011536EF1|nr:hypothetical protein [Candidatus Nitrosopumilus sp. SW]QDI88390.1 hypothetical protein Nisw_01990 [Candidatus Nitrosopumilus sp. SW]